MNKSGMKELQYENTFFRNLKYNAKRRVAVFVPHQDDEINIGGSTISALSAVGYEVYIIYTTNGDWKYNAAKRYKEAISASAVLGVDRDHLIFLGYADSLNNEKKDHIFYHNDDLAVSAKGRCQTYGAYGIDEFSFWHNGEHHTYTFHNYLSDVKAVIKLLRPDVILSTGFDEHPDHRALSLAMDSCLGEVLKEDPDYRPELFVRYAYCLAYCAEQDYFNGWNVQETKCPDSTKIKKYSFQTVDRFDYTWNSRVRIPVISGVRVRSLRKNMLAKALRFHRSQHIILKADRIINSDEVFWRRRTDNLALLAEVDVTSGEGKWLNDFRYFNVDNIDVPIPNVNNCAWIPDESDSAKTAFFIWSTPKTIKSVRIYPNYTVKDQILNLRLNFSNGFSFETGSLSKEGNAYYAEFIPQKNVVSCSVAILERNGERAGISECEFYSETADESVFPPFLKITINNNFAYNYYYENESALDLAVYRYGKINSVRLNVLEGQSIIKDNKLLINRNDKKIVLYAEAVTEFENKKRKIYDKVTLLKVNNFRKASISCSDTVDKAWLKMLWMNKLMANIIYTGRSSGLAGIGSKLFNKIKKILEK